MSKIKSLVTEAAQIKLASGLIELDARLQVLESETQLSRERLTRLYKEIKKKSPPKGMLPFSTDWFLTWQPNIHGSLFLNLYLNSLQVRDTSRGEALLKAFQMYREQVEILGLPEVLSMTRAWLLIRFYDSKQINTTACVHCDGKFLTHHDDLNDHYECGLCNMPARAGKTKMNLAEQFFNDEANLETV